VKKRGKNSRLLSYNFYILGIQKKPTAKNPKLTKVTATALDRKRERVAFVLDM